MAQNTRTTGQREADLVRLEEMYRAGHTQRQMGEALGVTHQQVAYDIKKLHTVWRESAIRDFDAAKAAEIALVDQVELEAMRGWLRSCEDAEGTTRDRSDKSSKIPKGKTKGKAKADPSETTLRVVQTSKGQSGDPNFLRVMLECSDKRSKLLGLYATPEQIAARDNAPTPRVDLSGLATSELQQMRALILKAQTTTIVEAQAVVIEPAKRTPKKKRAKKKPARKRTAKKRTRKKGAK